MSDLNTLSLLERGKEFSNQIIEYFQSSNIVKTIEGKEKAEDIITDHLKEFALRFAKEFCVDTVESLHNKEIELLIKVTMQLMLF
jgi:hypothetical protein